MNQNVHIKIRILCVILLFHTLNTQKLEINTTTGARQAYSCKSILSPLGQYESKSDICFTFVPIIPQSVVLSNTTSGYFKTKFNQQVDKFTLLHIPNTFNYSFIIDNQNISSLGLQLQVEIGNFTTGFKIYTTLDGRNVIPFYTAIITLQDGLVVDISWDEDCSACDTSKCFDGLCSVGYTECNLNGGDRDCDIQVYVGWQGTDKYGHYLDSAGKRLSRFRSYSLKSAYESAASATKDNIPDI